MIKRTTFIPFGNEADHSIDYLLGILQDARTTTLQRIEAMPKEELHWQIHEGWNTIGALLSHLIALDHYFRATYIEERKFNDNEKDLWTAGLLMGPKYLPELLEHQPVRYYVELMKESRAQLIKGIKNLSLEDFHRKREGYNPETGQNLAWVLYHLAEDEIHHRGQITLLHKLYKREVGS